MIAAEMLFLRTILLLSTLASLVPSRGQVYTNATDLLGISNVLNPIELGKGISFFDIDGNGWDDLTIGADLSDPLIFLNTDGVFDPAPFSIPNTGGRPSMLLWGDMDNDGDADLFVSYYQGKLDLWRNDGGWQFTNIASEAGLDQDTHRNAGAAWCDYDHDGFLDLYVTKFYSANFEPESGPPYRCMLYHNNGDGTFDLVTEEAGVMPASAPIFQPVFFDYDKDGWEDLFLVVDRPENPNYLYRNNGDGTFTDVSQISGMAVGVCSMSGSVADYDADGDLDMFISNGPGQGNLLMRNNGSGSFIDVGTALGLGNNIGGTWAGVWMDHDNNGREDLFVAEVAQGASLGNQFYVRQPVGGFVNANAAVGLTDTLESHVAARGDINNDGYYDLMTNNMPPFPSVLFQSSGGSNHYLSVSLQGTYSNRDGIGSWITCYAGDEAQVRYTLSGADFMGQSSGKYIFGLGATSTVDSLVVEWNRGTRDVYHDIPASQHLHLIEGATQEPEPPTIAISGQPFLCPLDTLTLSVGPYSSYLWSTGDTEQSIDVWEPGNYSVTVIDEFGNELVSEAVDITLAPTPSAEVTLSPVICYGAMDGMISVEFSNSPVQSIVWNTGATGVTSLNGLASGAYSYTAVDSFGCEDDGGGFIPEPFPLSAEITTQPVLCFGDHTGSVEIEATGGTPPYVVMWDPLDPGSLAAGGYEVELVDANGCMLSIGFEIDSPDELLASVTVTPASEGLDNGTAALELEGGSPGYTITWSTGVTDTTFVDDLAPGDHAVLVVDANGCEVSVEFTIGVTTGMIERSASPYRLYPVPARDMIRVVGSTASRMDITILDGPGRTVLTLRDHPASEPVPLSGISSGRYTMVLRTSDGLVHLPFILSNR